MRKNQYFIAQTFLLIVALAAVVPLLVFQFSNPELTSTQLILGKWEYYTAIFLCFVASQTIRYFFYDKLYK